MGVTVERESLVGIDVGAKELVVALQQDQTSLLTFTNDAQGHRKLTSLITKRGRYARVCLEATGIYSLDIAFALHRHKRISVMVANPRATSNFAKAMMKRAKTDAVDARTLLAFVSRMPFVPWQPPTEAVLALRSTTRRMVGITRLITTEKKRLHAAKHNASLPAFLLEDVKSSLEHLENRLCVLEAQALDFIAEDEALSERFELLKSIPGIADRSGLHLLAELLFLPSDMDVRQWVAHAGLDPRPFQSGTSVNKPMRISKAGNAYVRRALFMPALVAIQHDQAVRAFYSRLLQRGKPKMKANVAVMRKLLHAIYGIFKTNTTFDPKKCFPYPKAAEST